MSETFSAVTTPAFSRCAHIACESPNVNGRKKANRIAPHFAANGYLGGVPSETLSGFNEG